MEQEKRGNTFEFDTRNTIEFLAGNFIYIVLSAIILASVFMLYSMFIITPKYQSSTRVYVLSSENGDRTTLSDVQLSTQLTKDYESLIVSRSVTDEVISNLKLNLTNEELAKMISVTAPKDTRILEINVVNSDPYLARDIANSVREVSSDNIINIMNIDAINVVEEANLPDKPCSPNIGKNTAIGGFIGVFLSSIVLLIVFILDDKIKSSKDVEMRVGLPVLGVIPIDERLTRR